MCLYFMMFLCHFFHNEAPKLIWDKANLQILTTPLLYLTCSFRLQAAHVKYNY